jgi:3-deoxy-7-phosphoheptulonate synthase
MIIKLKKTSTALEKETFLKFLKENKIKFDGYNNYITILSSDTSLEKDIIMGFHGIEEIFDFPTPYKLASREFHPDNTIINIKGKTIGDGKLFIIAGPCSVDTKENLQLTLKEIKKDIQAMRGGAFKPRTSPYSFQGNGIDALKILNEVGHAEDVLVVSELMGIENIQEIASLVDILQVGARNMQNFPLLKEVGKLNKPVILKRGMGNSIEEWLLAAEYILKEGNPNVILCERGIRTFEKLTRNTLDISVIPLVKQLSHLPIIVDPSHATGRAELVEAVALASVAAGADGLIIEVHPNPSKALSDGEQSVTPSEFKKIMVKAHKIKKVISEI